MDKSTEYCTFVSVDYIICECGDAFPNEDALKDHLENDHSTLKQENKPTSLYDNFIDKRNIKKELKKPLVITEKLPEANLNSSTPVFLFDLEGNNTTTDYYLENGEDCETVTYVSGDIKQEEITVQYMDVKGEEYIEQNGEEYVEQNGVEYIEQNEEDIGIHEVVIKEEPMELNPLGCKQVTFRTSQQMVILAHENAEHDYDSEAKPLCQEYYFCDVCGKSFTTEKAVHLHMRKVHDTKQKIIRTAACESCGMTYSMWQRTCSTCGVKRPAAKPKQRTKQNLAKFTCDVCGVGRSSNAALRYHQRIHTGEKPYQCSMCPKAFTMPLFLQLHTRTHTGERPYKCPECPKAFSNQAALVRHNRVHTGVKPYSCPECGKAFTQSNSMKLHYQTVHLKMPAPYKSAARKLREAQKQGILLGASQIIIQDPPSPDDVKEDEVNEDPDIPALRHELLFRHRRRQEPQYDYVMEPVNCVIDDQYEEVYVPVAHTYKV